MIFDINKATPIPLAEYYDVCIAGGGVAGIVLALSLARRGLRILVLEAGGLEVTQESQSLYDGTNVGHDYFDLDACRLRFLGGTSNHWAGWCRPLDSYDFQARDFIEDSGWPIDIGDVAPYLPEARGILEIPAFPSDATLDGTDGRLKEVFKHRSSPVRFGEKYRDRLAASEAIDLFLNANLVDIELDCDTGRVSAFLFKGYDAEAANHRVVADSYVLALGGIENARTLLNANRQVAQGLANETGLVGRYFMEHPHFDIGYYVLGTGTAGFGERERFLAPTAKLMGEAGIASAHYQIKPILNPGDRGFVKNTNDAIKEMLCASDVVADFVRIARCFSCSRIRGAGRLRVGSEQVPNRNSRVSLSGQSDRFGLRRVKLDWRLTPLDKATMRVGAMTTAEHFATHDIGRVRLFDWVLDPDDSNIPGLSECETAAANHHMGTTRMGVSKQNGVVDRNCQIFGVENLYVAGSSVFRTGGYANPTLTIVQLALRLADHLAQSRVSRRRA